MITPLDRPAVSLRTVFLAQPDAVVRRRAKRHAGEAGSRTGRSALGALTTRPSLPPSGGSGSASHRAGFWGFSLAVLEV